MPRPVSQARPVRKVKKRYPAMIVMARLLDARVTVARSVLLGLLTLACAPVELAVAGGTC